MKNIEIFSNTELGNIRVCKKCTDVWFVAKDVAEILGHNCTTKMTRILDEDEKSTVSIKDFDHPQYGVSNKVRHVVLINESGLYSVMLRSRKQQAKKFKKWITSEVLPSIRKHGVYMTDTVIEKAVYDKNYLNELTKELKEERQARIAAKQRKLILLANNLKLHKDNNLLLIENKVLAADIFSWEAVPAIRKMINKLARALGADRSNFGGCLGIVL